MNKTKVVIAAAGQGTRMLNLSENCSKHLIKVCEKPFLSYLLDNLVKAGYLDFILVVGYRADLIEEFVKNYKRESPDLKISIINQFDILGPKEKEYGTACPLKCVKSVIGKDDFIYLYGDNLFSPKDLKEMNVRDEYCYVAGIESKNPERYGVLISENGFLKEIKEKPKESFSDSVLVNAGIYKFTTDIFDKVYKIKKSQRGEYEITDAVNLLARENKVKIKKIDDYWHDFGSPEDILKLSEFLSKYENH